MAALHYRLSRIDLAAIVVAVCVLLALILPAIQINRRRSRLAECSSRLHELAKVTLQFEMVKKRYPGVLEAFGKDEKGKCKVGSWAVALLPFIEQEPLYEAWQDPGTTEAWIVAGGWSSAAAQFYPQIALFRCADDSVSQETLGSSSYVCNAGFFPSEPPPSYSGMTAHEIAQRSSDPTNGVFSNQLPAVVTTYYTGGEPMAVLGSRAGQRTRAVDIKDGLTQTIALTENLQADSWGYVGKPEGWSRTTIGGVVYAGDDLHPSASPRVHTGCVWLCRAQPSVPGFQPVRPTNRINGNRFTVTSLDMESARPSSVHKGFVNVAMLGGNVSTLSENIDYVVYQALMTPHTQESDIPDRTYVLQADDMQR